MDAKTVTIAMDGDGFEAIYIGNRLHSEYETIFACDLWEACKGLAVRIERLYSDERIEEWPKSLNRLKKQFACEACH